MRLDPSTIGRYRVLGELGRGAMGAVYLAEDPVLKRGVAIKVVLEGSSMDRQEALSRFQREAETSARLAHPNVVTVFDVGMEPELGPYMAMEYVEGQSLSERIASGPVDPEEAFVLLVQGLHALEAAHACGIVHRDVKPENMMVTKDGRLKLMDFGIARDEEAEATTTALLCTPAFAAPELLARQPACAATDRWAFCVTAYQCLTGFLPFRASSLSGLLFQVAHEAPSFPEDLDPGLRRVFERAFAKDASERHADLRAFMRDLVEAFPLDAEVRARVQGLLDHPLSAALASAPPPRPAAGFLGLPRWAWIASASVAFAGLLLLAALLWPHGLEVESRPGGARVLVDGRELGTTPLRHATVPRGARLLRLEKQGFQPLERGLDPSDRHLVLDLVPLPLTVNLVSDPEGAEVYLNGVLRGRTPLDDLQIPGEGSHQLQVKKAGFETWSAQVGSSRRPPALVKLHKAQEHRRPHRPEAERPGFFRGLWERVTGK